MTTAAELISAAESADWSSFKSLVNAATPGDIAAIGSEWNDVMNSIATGVSGSATAAPKHLFNTAMESFFTAAGDYLTGDVVMDALGSIALNSAYNSADYLSVEMIAIINAIPAGLAATVTSFSLANTMSNISYNQTYNTEVTPTELKNTFAALTAKFGTQMDVGSVLNVAWSILNEDVNSHGNNLASVRVLLAAEPANKASANYYDILNVFDTLTMDIYNTAVPMSEMKNTLNAFLAPYGGALDVSIVLTRAAFLAAHDGNSGENHMLLVRTLLDAAPANKESASSFDVNGVLQNIGFNGSNVAITPEELNKTFKSLIANYGEHLETNSLLQTAEPLVQNGAFGGPNNLLSVETLLSVDAADKASADPYYLQNLLMSLSFNEGNPEVAPEELGHVFKVLVAHYGAQLDVESVLNTAAQLASNSIWSSQDYMSSVEALLAAQPDNKAFASPYVLQDIVTSIADNQQNAGVTADELAHTFRVLVANYGAVVDVNVVLNTIVQMAFNDSVNGTDYFSSVNALLGAHPDNAAMADPYNLSNALSMINGNAYNAAITEHELAQTIGKFMTNYGAQMDASDLGFFISDDVGAGAFEAAGAIANHMDATQFTDAASVVDTYSNALLLTTGNDSFDGSASAKVAVYGGAGRDVIDFSANPDSDSRYLDGGAGRDTLIGGLGDDVLVGGRGSDTLTGGDGADTFRFDHLGTHIDHVTDFNAAQGDRIDLHDVLGSEAGLAISDYVHLETSGGNTILSVDKDGTGGANGFVQVAQLDNVTGLDVNDLYANGQIIIG